MEKIIILLAFILASMPVFAEDVLLKITPVNKFSTTTKHVYEGDTVEFKIIETNSSLKKDQIISGIITHYTPNGFFGEPAMIVFSNFKTESGKKINGELIIKGGEHKKLQEFLNSSSASPTWLVRGSEIILLPDVSELSFFIKE